jgi:hypothetical protein
MTRKGRVSLLVALPVEFEDFIERFEKSDYLAKFRSKAPSLEKRQAQYVKRWRTDYSANVAEPLRKLMALSEELGADVRSQTTLADLRASATGDAVVILFSHWKGHEVLVNDLDPGWTESELASQASQVDSPLARFIANWFRTSEVDFRVSPFKWLAHRLARCRPKVSVRNILTAALERPVDDDLLGSPEVDGVMELGLLRDARRRDELDSLFGHHLRPGNRLELYDGLFSKEEVEAAIPSSFSGYLDLTICNSSVLAEYIGRARGYRFRTVQFPAEQEPIWGVHCLCLALRLHSEGAWSFGEARVLATALMERFASQFNAETPELGRS